MKQSFRHLVELLDTRAEETPNNVAYFFQTGSEAEIRITYAELRQRARIVAGALSAKEVRGERAVLLFAPSIEYVIAFFGCLYAGVIAVPAYPPDPSRLNRTLPRLRAIFADAGAQYVLTTSDIFSIAEFLFVQAEELRTKDWIAIDTLSATAADGFRSPELRAETTAFLQYTSGSTGTPKGVILTHENLLHNERLISHAMEFGREHRLMVSWLPPYHDMGLIGGILAPLCNGFPAVLMPPLLFLQQPLRWLQAISNHRATVAGSPNFGFDLCVRRVSDAERDTLDLSTLDVLFSGAEPVRGDTLDRFRAKFEPAGFRYRAFYPCYGLAEATLIVSGGRPAEEAVRSYFDREALGQGVVIGVDATAPFAQELIGCGRTILEQTVAIVDPQTLHPAEPSHVGEIWVAGGSVAQGYYRRLAETERTFHAKIADDGPRYLRTGDLGFLHDRELFITGRLKDLIIVRGRNLYPQDIERACELAHSAVRPGGVAAFSVEIEGEEKVVVIAEFERRHLPDRRKSSSEADARARAERDRRTDDPEAQVFVQAANMLKADEKSDSVLPPPDPSDASQAIRSALIQEFDLKLHAVVLIKPGRLPKTSSGKVQRHACRHEFIAGSFDTVFVEVASQTEAIALSEEWAPEQVTMRMAVAESAEHRQEIIARHLGALIGNALGVPDARIKRDVSLTEHGLDSLIASHVVAAVRTAYSVDLPLPLLFDSVATIFTLAQRVERTIRQGRTEEPVPRIETDDERFSFALSFSQERLLFLDELAGGSAANHLFACFRTSGKLDATVLEKSLRTVVDRHEALRTCFVTREGTSEQVIGPVPDRILEIVDGGSLSKQELDGAVDAFANALIDLTMGPVLLAKMVRRNDGTVLLLKMHHIVSDGWSIGVFYRELGALYDAHLTGAPIELPRLPIRFVDYCRWQRDTYSEARLDRDRAYWVEHLSNAALTLELATDFPRPPVQTYRGDRLSVEVGNDRISAVEAFAKERGSTLFMALLAVFYVWLSKHSGQRDIVVGTPVARRTPPETESVIGFFINTLPLRAKWEREATSADLLGHVKSVVLRGLEHQEIPLAKLVEALKPKRDLSRSPLFQSLFVMENAPEEGLLLGGHELALDSDARKTSQFDLTLTFSRRSGGVHSVLEYNSDLFSKQTAARMLEHFSVLLENIIANPMSRVSDLSVISNEERRLLLSAWNAAPSVVQTREMSIVDMLDDQVRKHPRHVALIDGSDEFTYEALQEMSDALAARLTDLGARAERNVGVCLRRGADMVIAQLAVMKTGAAFVPLDPSFPKDRLAFVSGDASLVAIVTDGTSDVLPESVPQLAVLESAEGRRARRESTHALGTAYVMYTSGSTGRPKGVCITHANVANFFEAMDEVFGTGPGIWYALTSISFDISVLELFWTLTRGYTVVVSKEDGGERSLRHSAAIRRYGVTHIQTTPSLFEAMLEEDAAVLAPTLRHVLLGGEALPSTFAKAVVSRTTAALHNMYGPTETTIWSTSRVLDGGGLSTPVASIGAPLKNTWIRVLDTDGNVCPIGVPGELTIGGEGVSRGYWQRPELTAERFVPDANGQINGDRLYRTGDLARWGPEGDLEFFGRLDHQVKVRGLRIELGEIEMTLTSHEDVKQAIVTVREDEPGSRRIVAYVVLKEGGHSPDLRERCRESLPEYMTPNSFVVLERFPLTPNGKVDRRALPRPETESPSGRIPPRNDEERAIAELYREILGVNFVGADDSFFDLGGHSLSAMRLTSRIRRRMGVEVPLAMVFTSPSVEGLARVLASARRVPFEPIPKSPRRALAPLSYSQERLFFLEQMEPLGRAYVMAAAFQLSGLLDVEALERAFAVLVLRHEVLRSRFELIEGNVVQVVDAPPPKVLQVVDARDFSADRFEQTIQHSLSKGYDLTKGMPIRAEVYLRGTNDHVLCVSMHHIVSDGWSVGVAIRELATSYASPIERSAHGELPLQFADVAIWQRGRPSHLLDDGLSYWRKELERAPAFIELPIDKVRPRLESHRGAAEHLALSPKLMSAVRVLAKTRGTTPFVVLLSAYFSWLSKHVGKRDIVCGTPVSGRTHPDLEPLIGMFVNSLPIRARWPSHASFIDLVDHVSAKVFRALEYQDVPLAKLIEVLEQERDRSRNPLFQVQFVLQNTPREELSFGSVRVVPLERQRTAAQFELSLECAERSDGGTDCVLEYNTDLFEKNSAQQMLQRFSVLLEASLREPERSMSAVVWLDESVRREALRRSFGEERVNRWKGLADQLRRASRETPAAIAVREGERTWTYAEWERSVSALAAQLTARGVGNESVVGICMQRSAELCLAVWAVLVAGAAYLPLDPELPLERLRGMARTVNFTLVTATARPLGEQFGKECLEVSFSTLEQGVVRTLVDIHPKSLSYVIFTSGSTGEPKGAMNMHQGLTNRIEWMQESYRASSKDVILQKTPFSFDVSVWEFFWPIAVGATLEVVSPGAHRDPRHLAELIERRAVTICHFVPSMLVAFLEEIRPGRCPSLRLVVCSGEALADDLRQRFETKLPGCRLENLYGPTEASVDVTSWTCKPGERGAVPIGKPVWNTSVYVLDDERELVPERIVGELYLAGSQVGRGYSANPALTAERFLPDNASGSGGVMYRTGDLGRRRDDGAVEYFGRADHQVKLRGFRIELGEIEISLMACPGVKNAAVLLRGSDEKRFIAAFIVGEGLNESSLKELLGARLPQHMVPTRIVVVDELPLTSSGKVDRRVLAQKDVALSIQEVEYEAPTGALEIAIAYAWSRALGAIRVGRQSNFFELGGHSLLAMKVVAELREALGRDVTIGILFEAPTLASFAARLALTEELESEMPIERVQR